MERDKTLITDGGIILKDNASPLKKIYNETILKNR